MTKPTPEQIQRACDLANTKDECYWPNDYGKYNAFTALADTIARLDAMQAERDKALGDAEDLQASLDKTCADLGEIDRIVIGGPWIDKVHCLNSVAAITARYRAETDPLADSIIEAFEASTGDVDAPEWSVRFRAELAKRGLAFTKCDPERLPV